MKKFLERLLKITEGCRPDMHEPDEQDVRAMVSGYHFDNAMGDDPKTNCGEITVGIVRDDEKDGPQTEWFNLATLISLARMASLTQNRPVALARLASRLADIQDATSEAKDLVAAIKSFEL